MTALPKPLPRGPKPRKPISRGKRPKGSRTSNHRKERKAKGKDCAAAWSLFIRTRAGFRCELLGHDFDGYFHGKCGGVLQGMHAFPKGAYPHVKYAVWNGFSGCKGIHRYLTNREVTWHRWLRKQWGEALYEERYRQALMQGTHDFPEILRALRSALAALPAGTAEQTGSIGESSEGDGPSGCAGRVAGGGRG